MTTLRPYVDDRAVSTGSEFMRSGYTGSPVSSALLDLASSIGQYGNKLAAEEKAAANKAQRDQERLDRIEAENRYVIESTNARVKLREFSENIADNGRGFTGSFAEWYDKTNADRMKFIPDSLRPEYEHKFLAERERLIGQAADIEFNQRRQFMSQLVKEKGTFLSSAVTDGSMAPEAAHKDISDFVGSLGLPPNADARMRRDLGLAVDSAAVRRAIELNPDQVVRDLGRYAAGKYESDNPVVRSAIEAAQRNNVPVSAMLAIVKGESNFNPNSQAKGSTAYGLGQMIDANWRETGIPKTADPVLQAEATARMLRNRMEFLQSNGVEATTANLWASHFLGPSGFLAVLRANPNTPIRDVLLPLYGSRNYAAATSNNAGLLRDGMTTGQVMSAITNYMQTREASLSSDARIRQGADPRELVKVGDYQAQYLTAADASKLYGVAQESVEKRLDGQMKMLTKQKLDDGIFNPYDAADRKDVDKWAMTTGVVTGMNKGDPSAYGEARAFLDNNKYLPKPYAAQAKLDLLSNDPARRELAFDLLSRIEAANPLGGLENSGINGDIKKRVERINALRTENGLTVQEAMNQVSREFDPTFNDKVKRDKTKVEAIVSKYNSSHLETAFNSRNGWWIFGGTEFGSGSAQREMSKAFQDRIRYHLNDGAQEATAAALAMADMKKAYGLNDAFGERRLMHWPPEMLLPTIGGDHKWVANVTTDFVNAALEASGHKYRVTPKDVGLLGTAETARNYINNQPLHYSVWFTDDKGNRQMLLGGINIDPQAYKSRFDTERKVSGEPTADVAAARAQQKAQNPEPLPPGERRRTMPLNMGGQ